MIKRELIIFLIVGLLTVALDFFIYIELSYLGVGNINIAKGLSFIGGTIFSYFANRFWTFQRQDIRSGSVGRFLIVYIVGLIANILVNHVGLLILNNFMDLINSHQALFLAFVLATGISAILNFLGMKFFVFTNSPLRSSSFFG